MLNGIASYWIETIGPSFAMQEFTLPPFPPGTNVQATIALSFLDTLFAGNTPDPTYAVAAFISAWTYYESDGTPSAPQGGIDFTQNAVYVENCATITFVLSAERAAAIAQVNVFTV